MTSINGHYLSEGLVLVVLLSCQAFKKACYCYYYLNFLDSGFYPSESNFDSFSSSILIERQAGNHLEGIPFYGPRSDISGHETSNRIVGSKRNNPDSAFLGSFRDGIINLDHDPLENSHLIKVWFVMTFVSPFSEQATDPLGVRASIIMI